MTQLTSDQLHAGIRALAKDVVDAVIHWKLSRGILEAAETWPLVIQQSNTFWSLTITAHINVSILAMCRVSDGKISWRKVKDSTATDVKRLAEEHPELVARYEVIKPGYRRFVVQIGK